MSASRYKIRLNKGDTVIVLSGKYRGKTGKVLATHPKVNRVTIEGVNTVKRHHKPSKANPQGGIIEQVMPLDVSKVAAYEPTLKKPSRVRYSLKAGAKTRVYARSGKEIK